MGRPSQYPPELRERAVRMVLESQSDYPNRTAAIKSVAAKFGILSTESLREWVAQAEVDGGVRPGKTSDKIAVNRPGSDEDSFHWIPTPAGWLRWSA